MRTRAATVRTSAPIPRAGVATPEGQRSAIVTQNKRIRQALFSAALVYLSTALGSDAKR